MKRINIKIEDQQYPYLIFENISAVAKEIEKYSSGYDNSIVIYDSNVPKTVIDELLMYSDSFKSDVIPFEVSESNKTLFAVDKVLDLLLSHSANRNSLVYIVGGGVLGNIAGLACGLLYRGINFVHIPTTIMACSDSVLSLKQGINKNDSKNIVGMYYAPKAVMMCPELYNSLDKRDVTAGYVEYVKNLLIVIPDKINDFLSENIDLECLEYRNLERLISLSIEAKLALIASDKYEKKDGILLEYGHTIGHALEMLLPNGLRHGEGVAIGIIVASRLSYMKSMMTNEELNIIFQLLKKVNAFKYLEAIKKQNPLLDYDRIENILRNDNKNGYISCQKNQIAMVILEHFGKPLKTDDKYVVAIELEDILKSIKMFLEEGM